MNQLFTRKKLAKKTYKRSDSFLPWMDQNVRVLYKEDGLMQQSLLRTLSSNSLKTSCVASSHELTNLHVRLIGRSVLNFVSMP